MRYPAWPASGAPRAGIERHTTTGRAWRARLDCIALNMAKRHGPRTPVVLIVLDGWGFRPGREGNAIELGDTPTWHRLWANASRTLLDRKSTRLNSSHLVISYAVFCLKKKKEKKQTER